MNRDRPFIFKIQILGPLHSPKLILQDYPELDFNIDWGDGSEESYIYDSNIKKLYHTYKDPGEYIIKISGNLCATALGLMCYATEVISFGDCDWRSMDDMFRMAFSLKKVSFKDSSFNKLEDMKVMFQSSGIENVDLSNIDLTNVKDMKGMFANCTKLEVLDFSKVKLSKDVNIDHIFEGCHYLKEVLVSPYNAHLFKSQSENITIIEPKISIDNSWIKSLDD
jgi:hypothetical protein